MDRRVSLLLCSLLLACITPGGAAREEACPACVACPACATTPGSSARGALQIRVGSAVAPPFPVSAERRARVVAGSDEVAALVDGRMAAAGCPGGSVGIVFGDELVWSKGYGSRDGDGKVAVDTETVFRIGSITKTFTALSLLLLREEGRLDFDEPIVTFVPEAGGIVYPTTDSQPIATWHLVTHSSGLPRVGPLVYSRPDRDVTEQELTAAFDNLYLESSPGLRTKYSNLAFALAGLVVQRVSGMRYRDFVSSRILTPIGMASTYWDDRHVPKSKLATGFSLQRGKAVPTPNWRLGAAEGMGGLYTSLTDFARYASFQLSAWPARDGEETGLLKRNILRESHLTASSGLNRGTTMGVGWALVDEKSVGHVVAHTGDTGNFSASIRLLPERGLGVVAWCSLGDTNEKLEAMEQSVLEVLVRRDPAPEVPLSGPVAQAIARVQRHLEGAKKEEMRQSFSPSFLAELPPAQMVEFFTKAAKESGRCAKAVGLEADGLNAATVRLDCERGSWNVNLRTSSQPPFLIESLWLGRPGRD